jgi:cell division protein FtsW
MFRALIGMLLLLVASQIDFRTWRRWARPSLIAAAGSLAVVFLFNSIRGARGWVHLFGATVQPVEFARLAPLVFLAAELARLGPRIRSLRHGLLPLCAVIGAVLLLVVKQPDFGSAMALSLICGTMLFIGGARLVHLGGAATILLSGAGLLAWRFPHVRVRFLGFLAPDSHAAGGAYQSLQSVLSIGSGGLFGKGLGQGFAKYGYLPDPHTDSSSVMVKNGLRRLRPCAMLFDGGRATGWRVLMKIRPRACSVGTRCR